MAIYTYVMSKVQKTRCLKGKYNFVRLVKRLGRGDMREKRDKAAC